MVGAKTGVATCINEMEAHAHHCSQKLNTLQKGNTFNRLREDTTPASSVNKTLCSNRWVIRGALLQCILDNWAVFQELWIEFLSEK